MKTLLVINPHSFIDVITNSSTELFVCDTDKSIETVKEILAADPNVYGYEEPWVFHLDEYRKWKAEKKEAEIRNKAYWDLHKKPSKEMDKFWNSGYSNIEGWFYDIEDEDDLEYLRKHYIEDGDNSGGWWSSDRNPFNERLRNAENNAAVMTKSTINDENRWRVRQDAKKAEIQKIYDETAALDEKPDWWINPVKYHYNNQPVNDLDGKIMIIGEGDNSIPFDHFDWIENIFNATRHHLG
jgi:hypothetical protein